MLDDQIAMYGFVIVGLGHAPAPREPVAVHTVGLHDMGLPEVVAQGLPLELSTCLLDFAASWLIDHPGEADGALQKCVLHVPQHARPVCLTWAQDRLGERVAPLAWERSRGAARFVQICLADDMGRWPWDGGYQLPVQGPGTCTHGGDAGSQLH
ncbi:DUF4262 domain-containing protein [Ottowia sp.]|uniref:DUF4262 domain-containing protein n=1 Tax=Ottowia sp. TaxID=1898956 RepID=UPI0025D71AFE|nr:DUF4262 domain-containing protein [Ottowia sp.]MBK6616609.1 DUF4262 domain-containing protein [Ottowia sp.]